MSENRNFKILVVTRRRYPLSFEGLPVAYYSAREDDEGVSVKPILAERIGRSAFLIVIGFICLVFWLYVWPDLGGGEDGILDESGIWLFALIISFATISNLFARLRWWTRHNLVFLEGHADKEAVTLAKRGGFLYVIMPERSLGYSESSKPIQHLKPLLNTPFVWFYLYGRFEFYALLLTSIIIMIARQQGDMLVLRGDPVIPDWISNITWGIGLLVLPPMMYFVQRIWSLLQDLQEKEKLIDLGS
jgi:hypothetical protein